MSTQCAECAFHKGCETWYEPHNRVVSEICAAGPLPFACHSNLDWRSPAAAHLPVQWLTRGKVQMCEGWKASVRSKQWPKDRWLRMYQRSLAHCALEVFSDFRRGDASLQKLTYALRALGVYYRGPRASTIAKLYRFRRDECLTLPEPQN